MQQSIAIVVFLLLIGAIAAANDHRHLRSVLGAFFDQRAPPPSPQPVACTTGCAKNTAMQEDLQTDQSQPVEEHYSVTDQELTALRIEYIKNQILKKLRLKEKPVSTAQLPPPVSDKVDVNDVLYNHYGDDFYGKTTQAIIFPYEDEAKCVRKIRNPSACVPFQMPTDIAASDVSAVDLWFYKEADILDNHNQTFVISEVAHWDTNKSFQKNKPIAIKDTSLTEGWIRVDVAYVIKNWLLYQDTPTHAISVACKTCGMPIMRSPISFDATRKPFLVIRTHTQHLPMMPRRHKRHADCVPGGKECCRESMYVSFAEIGWDDWIIAPHGYNAYFCKGSCRTAASLTLNPTDYNVLLRRVMYGGSRNRTQRLELTQCCAATQFKPLQLVYTDTNKSIQMKILPNMVVESCGCM